MNEKLFQLLETVRTAAVQAGDVAADAAYGASKKAGELVSVAKLNIQIAELKHAVGAALREVGELLYATHTGNPTDSEILQAKLEEIDGLKARIAQLEGALGREKAARVCTTCGAEIKEADVFCRECGDIL